MRLLDCLESKYMTDQEGGGYFSPEMQDLIRAAQLTQDQIKILEHLFLDEMKLKDVIKLTSLSKRQVTILRESAFKKLKQVMTTVKSKEIV